MSTIQSITNASASKNQQLSRYLPLVLNPNGSITRVTLIPTAPATPDPNSASPVLSKDLPVNPQLGTWVRVYLPREALDKSSGTIAKTKLPLIIYFHGGGFIAFSAATANFHRFCDQMAAEVGAVVISVEHRLAPEHRLPAAYDDTMEALMWIKASNDEWLREFADLSECFLMGNSAGGNIAYHAGLRAAAVSSDLEPLKIKGLILHSPYFGGIEKTASEMRLANDPIIPLFLLDFLWELSLPVGADRDHEYSNLTVSIESTKFDQFRLMGCRLMVTGFEGDPLIDRQKELGRRMREKGVQVVEHFSEGGEHSVEFKEPSKAKTLLANVQAFVHQSRQVKEQGN